jgi:hypothetical protein
LLAALAARVHPQSVALRSIESAWGVYPAFYRGIGPIDLDSKLEGLGYDFSILGFSTKHLRASGSYVLALELTRSLIKTGGLHAEDVVRIEAFQNVRWEPRGTYYESHFEDGSALPESSLRFQLSIMLLDGGIDPKRYDAIDAPEIRDLMGKVELRWLDDSPPWYTRIEITTKDGRTLKADGERWDEPKGGKGGWRDWLPGDGERLLGKAKFDRMEDLVAHLERVDDVVEVMACVVPDAD